MFPILFLSYRALWKPLLLATVLFITLYIAFQIPLLNFLNVDRNTGGKQLIFLHHIAAHIEASDPLNAEKNRIVSVIMPLNDWNYDCCSAIPIMQARSYSEPYFSEISDKIFQIFIHFATKEPQVEIGHIVCVTSLIWELPNHCENETWLPVNSEFWINENTPLIQENSLLPTLLPFFSKLLIAQRTNLNINKIISPAIYLYLGIFFTGYYSFRKQESKSTLVYHPGFNSIRFDNTDCCFK